MRPPHLLAVLTSLAACGVPATELGTGQSGQTGASLTIDYFGDTDVVGFHFTVERVACDAGDSFVPETTEANVDLVDGIFPGMISLVEQALDADSRHLGSDLFLTLEPGCYDVTATPAASIDGDDWIASADCATASAEGIEVLGGQTTEATLLSQCLGDPIGGLDVLVLLNHPPSFDLEIDEKFNYECEPVNVCATISDPDDDPIEVVWTNLSSTPWFSIDASEPEVIGFEEGHRIWGACAEIVTQWTDSYDVLLEVYDLGNDGGTTVRLEELVVPEESHAELVFPIHTDWIEEPLCFDGEGALVPTNGSDVERAEGCAYTDAETYYCSGDYDVEPAILPFLCDGAELIEEALYPECPPGDEICDGLDNDSDGLIDEGFTTGLVYTYSDSPSGNDAAGAFDLVESTFNTLDQSWTFHTELSHNNGTTDAFTLAISDGPNPKGQGELALLYVDCTGGASEPTITVYGYNGLNSFTSYYDGSDDSGVQAPDPIASSLADDGFVLASSCEDDGTTLTVELTLDVTGINAHTPLYPSPWPWEGVQHGGSMGIWFHPWSSSSFSYDAAGWITSATQGWQGWFDASYLPAPYTEICVPD